MNVNLRRAFRHPILFLRTLSPLSLAHHPACEQFIHHCIRFRGRRLCIGCFIGFPATFIALALLVISSYFGMINLALFDIVLLGVVIEVVALLAKIVHHSKRTSARVVMKIAQATGIAFILFAPLSLPWPAIAKILVVLMIWMTLNMAMSAVRMYETGKTCDACEYKARWSECPGFRETVKKLYRAGFITE